MKITEIPVGVELYRARGNTWAQPQYGGPETPVTRVNDKRYSQNGDTWSSGSRYYEDARGTLVKIKVPAQYPGRTVDTTEYVVSGQIRGLYAEVFPQVKAFCDARDAAIQARKDELAAQRGEIVDLLSELAELMGSSQPTADNPLSWRISDDAQHVRMSRHGLRAIIGHIKRQDQLIEQLDDDCRERYAQLRAAVVH